MMISAMIVREGGDDNVYALLTSHSRVPPTRQEVGCELIRGSGQPRLRLGTLVPATSVLGDGGDKLGFHILRLDKTPLFGNLRSVATPVATVKNFRKGIWGIGAFKVRRLNDPVGLESASSGKRNCRVFTSNRKGRVAGEMDRVSIQDLGKTLEFSYCGLVSRGRGRPLGERRALGAPVISQAGALSAIIVGAAAEETLVYPIEELCKGRSIEFVTLGDDWPKLKVASNRKAAHRVR